MMVTDPQTFNRYSYVGSQPTNYVDPSGLMRLDCTWTGQQYTEGGTNNTYQCTWRDDSWNGYNGGLGGGGGGNPIVDAALDTAKELLKYGPCAELFGGKKAGK